MMSRLNLIAHLISSHLISIDRASHMMFSIEQMLGGFYPPFSFKIGDSHSYGFSIEDHTIESTN